MTLVEWFLILLFLGISAFLSLSEIALVGISKIRLRHMVEKGIPAAKTVHQLVARLDEVISMILVGSNFVNAALTSIITAACVAWLGESRGVLTASLLAGTMVLLLTDIVPKMYAVRSADRVSLRVAFPMWFLVRMFQPVNRSVAWAVRSFLKLFNVALPSRSPLITEEELKIMIEMGREEGVLGEHERMLLHRILAFGDLKVKEICVPRERMVALPASASHEEILRVLTEEGHSRIPIYGDSPDRITGIIYAQEMLHIWREGWLIALQDLLHPPFEIGPERRVSDLLLEFQRQHVQIAIVVDEKGSALGLVTLEDLLEEIVGEMQEKVTLEGRG